MSVSLPASSSNRHPLLAAYILQLALHPLRTKALTTGALTFAQEVIASHLARVPARHPPKDAPVYAHALARARIDAKALKMGLYGLLVSAPLSHVLVGALQRAFAGRTSPRARLAQLLASNLVIAPIQTVAYLASMALINGATSVDQVIATVKAGFMTVIRVTWVSSPLSVVFAQSFLSPDLWIPFFNLIQFTLGTAMNTKVKRMQLAAQRAKAKKDNDGKEK